jgi:hypothetical protein
MLGLLIGTYIMNKRRTELTLLLHVFLLLSGLMMIIMFISEPNYTYGFSANVNQRDGNSIMTSCHAKRNSSIQDGNNRALELNKNVIIIIGHNAAARVDLVGKMKLSSLSSPVPATSEGQQLHVIPFHPKNLTSFLAEKRQADLGLVKPSVKVFSTLPSNHSYVNQTK